MSVLFILIGVSILVAGGFLLSFIWSVRDGQYDDGYTPSVRMLFDNVPSESEKKIAEQNEKEYKDPLK